MSSAQRVAECLGLARDSLKGKVAVVTGGGRGIGREIVRVFARLGAKVVIAEVTEEGAWTERVIRDSGGKALFVKTDVLNDADVLALAQKTREAFGPADILINNAILCPVGPVLDMDAVLWDRVIGVNLRGAFLTCKAFLPNMLAKGQGVIVNMVSTDAMPYLSAYIASKQGLAGFTQSLAAEVGESGVRVIAFGPGFVDTPGLRQAGKQLAPRLGMTPEEFFQLSMHPAYDGMMPAEHAAAATAYLIIRLAGDYHGDVVDGYTVLERAGFIKRAGADAQAKGEVSSNSDAATGSHEDARQDAGTQTVTPPLDEAIALAGRLEEVIRATDDEFARLPIFIRPIARRGFKARAGQSIHEWGSSASGLAQLLKQIREGDGGARERLRAGYPSSRVLLLKLIAYYQAVPGETARFTRDADLIQRVTRTMAERQAQLERMIEVLDEVTA